MQTNALEKLARAIRQEDGRFFLVGGPVRDELLGNPNPKDLDFVIWGIPIDKLKKLLRKFGWVNIVGQAFGVIKFQPFNSDVDYDISLPRKEVSTGIGHRDFEIAFNHTLPIEEDLGRRDFTINAMAREFPVGALIDPFNGRQDLADRILRMVFESSFTDDPLRMIRGVQFAARFGLTVEPKTLAAMARYAELIKTISTERITDELNKLLSKANQPSPGFRLMQQTGILKHVLPELDRAVGVDQPGGYHRWDVFEHTLHTIDESPAGLRIRLAALFHDLAKPDTRELVEGGATFYGHDKLGGKMAKNAMKRLRYPTEMIKQVDLLVERHMFNEKAGEKGIRRLINRVGQDLIFDLIALRKADTLAQGFSHDTRSIDDFRRRVDEEIAKKSAFGIKDIAVNGDDIMEHFKLKPGPVIGEILNYLLEKVLDEPEVNEREKLLRLAGEYLARRQP